MKKIYIIAAIAAIIAGVLLYAYLGKLEDQATVEVQSESVLVAGRDIPAYTQLTEDMVTVAQVPDGSAHAQAAHSAEEAVGKMTEGLILAGEQILPAKLKDMGENASGLSYIVPQGMRAVTIAVDEVSGVDGLIKQGDYVDIIAYAPTGYPAEPFTAQTQNGTTLLVAQDILVAALDSALTQTAAQAIEGAQEAPNTAIYGFMTLIVTPEDAMRIVAAYRSGVVSAVLRATGDHKNNRQKPLASDDLLILPS
ncbi:MAG: Flp pilus assembly protein CpaB [Clostridia bacterium]